MFKNKPEPSIRRQLLLWLALSLGCLWISSSAVVFLYADSASDTIYDQQLLDSADSVTARIKMRNGKALVHLPESTLSIIEHGNQNTFYFQIRDGYGNLLSPTSPIPGPFVMPQDHHPVFKDEVIDGMPTRTVTMRITAPDTDEALVLQVAETLNSRNQLRDRILLNIIASQVIVMVIGSCAVYFGVTRGLVPLRTVKEALAERSSTDLRPVSEYGVPVEVLPLVEEINNLLDRLRSEIDSQKRFVANAAHQIRTPVAGLKTYVGFARRLAETPELKDVLQQVDVGTDRLTHLTNRLLSLARAEPNNKRISDHESVDLNAVVSEALSQLVAKAITEDIELDFEAAPEASVIGSIESLEELVTNIVENAIIYTQAGGRVHVGISKSASQVRLIVQDNGPGIPPEERKQIFERFYRIMGTEPSGSGLGLAIVKEIALAHKAEITVDAGPGGLGTLVCVAFPAVH